VVNPVPLVRRHPGDNVRNSEAQVLPKLDRRQRTGTLATGELVDVALRHGQDLGDSLGRKVPVGLG
jgi:hypothetical protein